ncbi:VCBS domain-containing protein, partial [Aeromonas tecta]
TYNVANAAVQYLKEGETKVETFTVQSADGTTHTVTITITGTNDLPTIAGDDKGAVTEDAANPTLTDSGVLTVTDADAGQSVFVVGNGVASNGALGSLTITEGGAWTYSVANAAVQYLKEGETKVETFTVQSADGTTHTVTITITGANDAPVLQADVGAVNEDAILTVNAASGVLANDSDVDGNALKVTGILNGTTGTATTVNASGDTVLSNSYGTLTIRADGSYSFNANGADAQKLAA